jgi:hypothetical protein
MIDASSSILAWGERMSAALMMRSLHRHRLSHHTVVMRRGREGIAPPPPAGQCQTSTATISLQGAAEFSEMIYRREANIATFQREFYLAC